MSKEANSGSEYYNIRASQQERRAVIKTQRKHHQDSPQRKLTLIEDGECPGEVDRRKYPGENPRISTNELRVHFSADNESVSLPPDIPSSDSAGASASPNSLQSQPATSDRSQNELSETKEVILDVI